jgi:hypothetical protein
VLAPGFPESEVCNPIDFLRSESDAEMARQIAAVLNKNFRLMTQSSEDGFFAAADNQLTEALAHEKSFTNFSLNGVGGQHMGKALGQGRFTVLSPTVGPSGKAYVNVQRVPPIWVERLDAIGLYPVSGHRDQGHSRQSRPHILAQPPQPGVLRLEDLATAKAQAVLHGDSPLESRSHSLTYALREFYGWENWAAQNRVLMSGNAEELARAAGAALGIDAERVERIMESVADPASCTPAAVFAGGETSAWKRVWKLDRGVYQELCPDSIQQSIQATARENHHVLTDLTSKKWTFPKSRQRRRMFR